MFSFKSVGHALATWFKAAAKDAPVVIDGIEKLKPIVDKVLPLIPGIGTVGMGVTDISFACLGELGSVIHLGGEAGKAKLADAGLDIQVIRGVEDLIAQFGGLGAFIKALSIKTPAAA